MMKLCVIGSNMVDLTTYIDRMPVAGETLAAPSFTMGCGGKGANQAVAAARCGADVWMVTKVGDDPFADNTIRNFAIHGIHTDYVEKVPGKSSGVAPIFVDKNGQNSILIVKGANESLLPSDVDRAQKALVDCDMILLQLEIPLETVYHAVDYGKKHNIPVLLNPAPAVRELDLARVAACDFFVPNETELSILTGMPTDTDDEVERAAGKLLKDGFTNIIVTLGGRGSLWMTANQKQYVPPYKVSAVDTSGAGDAFIGCFASGCTGESSVIETMKRASAFAALSVMKKGTQMSYPSAVELEDFIKRM